MNYGNQSGAQPGPRKRGVSALWWIAIPAGLVGLALAGLVVFLLFFSKPAHHVREAAPTSAGPMEIRSSQPFDPNYRLGARVISPTVISVPVFDTREAIEADGAHHVASPHALDVGYSQPLTDTKGARGCRECTPTDHVLCAPNAMLVVVRRGFFFSLAGHAGEQEYDEVEVADGPDKGKHVFVWASELTSASTP